MKTEHYLIIAGVLVVGYLVLSKSSTATAPSAPYVAAGSGAVSNAAAASGIISGLGGFASAISGAIQGAGSSAVDNSDSSGDGS